MNNISKIRRAYKGNEIDNVDWIGSEQNIADHLTRLAGNGILLTKLHSGTLHFILERRVCRIDDNNDGIVEAKIEED